jgi:hypothetical protein
LVRWAPTFRRNLLLPSSGEPNNIYLNFISAASTQHDTKLLKARRFIDYGEVCVSGPSGLYRTSLERITNHTSALRSQPRTLLSHNRESQATQL